MPFYGRNIFSWCWYSKIQFNTTLYLLQLIAQRIILYLTSVSIPKLIALCPLLWLVCNQLQLLDLFLLIAFPTLTLFLSSLLPSCSLCSTHSPHIHHTIIVLCHPAGSGHLGVYHVVMTWTVLDCWVLEAIKWSILRLLVLLLLSILTMTDYCQRPEPPHSILDPQLPFLAIFPRVKILDFKTKDPPPPLSWVWDLHSASPL